MNTPIQNEQMVMLKKKSLTEIVKKIESDPELERIYKDMKSLGLSSESSPDLLASYLSENIIDHFGIRRDDKFPPIEAVESELKEEL